MNDLLERALPLLACPDDRAPLMLRDATALGCRQCARTFPLHEGSVVELLPSAPPALPAPGAVEDWYQSYHRRLFQEPFTWKRDAVGWGERSVLSRGHRFFVDEEVRVVQELLPGRRRVLADVSAGTGSFSLALAAQAELVFHLDLDVSSINHGHREANRRRLENLVFVRCDYLALPLQRGVVDACLCLDTLERGPVHDRAVMQRVAELLSPSGSAILDFHNRRPGLAAIDARRRIGTHDRPGFASLLESVGLLADTWSPLGFLPAPLAGMPLLAGLDRWCWKCLPPIRFVVRAQRKFSGERS